MPDHEPASDWVAALVEGDERVVGEFWQEFGDRLNRLAERHLSPRLQQRVGSEDVIQSVCRTFFRRAREGQFELPDAEALWRLLCVLTLTKCRMLARFHGRGRRQLGREQALEAGAADGGANRLEPAASEAAPDDAAALADELATLLAGLDAEERQLVELKLLEHTNEEIAAKLNCSERTVRRVLKRVQDRWRQSLAVNPEE